MDYKVTRKSPGTARLKIPDELVYFHTVFVSVIIVSVLHKVVICPFNIEVLVLTRVQ